ncbi:MAG: DNA gyrase subunit A [Marmoricola sp.]
MPRPSWSSSTNPPRWRKIPGINAVALVDGQPKTLGLKDMLQVFLEHRFEVVRRRSAYRRGKAADRLHLAEGLLLAIIDIDEVIQLIWAAATMPSRLASA